MKGEGHFRLPNRGAFPTSLVRGECQVQMPAGHPSLWPLPSCIICHFCHSCGPGKRLLLIFFKLKKNPRFDLSSLKDANAFLLFSCLSSCQEGTLVFYLLCVKGKQQPPTDAEITGTLGDSLGFSLWVGRSLWTAHEQPSWRRAY